MHTEEHHLSPGSSWHQRILHRLTNWLSPRQFDSDDVVQELRDNERQIAAVLETAADSIIMIDHRGRIESFNPAAERMFGYARDEVLGKNVKMLMPAPFSDEHDGYLTRYLHTGEKKVIGIGREVVGRRKDGSIFPMELAVSEVVQGNRRTFTGIVRDITERKLAEEKGALLTAIVESSVDAIIGQTLDAVITSWNKGAERLYGYTAEEMVGESVSAIVPETRRLEFKTLLDRVGRGELIDALDTVRQRKDGTLVDVSLTLSPIMDGHGTVVGASVAARDVSERKRFEKELQWYAAEQEASRARIEEQAVELERRNRELDRSNQELAEFAHIASHDLKEPLNGISSYATMLLEDYEELLDTDGKKKLETLTTLASRMDTIISTLLYYSRVGRTELAVQPTDLAEVVHDVVQTLQIRLDELGVEVRLPEEGLPTAVCDGVRIGEVFRNLITNAMKYNDKPEKWLEIGCERSHEGDVGAWKFWVRDNGIGIRKKHLGSVFQIFRRLHGRNEFGGGTGAGLTIIEKIIKRHGGRIWVESVFGEGTAFFFTLPDVPVAVEEFGSDSERRYEEAIHT